MVKCIGEPSASEIVPGLWLGDEESANNLEFLNKYDIKNIIRFLPGEPTVNKHGINYMLIPWNDEEICNVFKIDRDITLENSFNYIENSLSNCENILVHCKRGHHRSASIVASFMIHKLNMDPVKVVNYIKSKRKCSLRRLSCMVRTIIDYHRQQQL